MKWLIIATSGVVLASTITTQDYNAQITKSCGNITTEVLKMDSIYNKLSNEEKNKLKSTFIGDGSMSQYDVLSMAHDQVCGGVESYNYYLNHLGRKK